MATLAEYCGQTVNLDVHTSKDYQFKKPTVSTLVEITFNNEISPLFSHINVWGKSFKVNVDNVDDISGAKAEFLTTLNELNEAFICFSSKKFILSVFQNTNTHLEKLTKIIRNKNGNPIPTYQYKSVMQSAIEDVLSIHGMSPKCNIGNGTLYNGERVLVNSGVTCITNLSSGLFSFFGFSPDRHLERQYSMLREKLLRGYDEGTWLNRVGDRPLVIAYKVMILSAFKNFLTTIVKYLVTFADDATCISLKDAAEEDIENLQRELDIFVEQKELDRDVLLGHSLVCESESYKQVIELGLGDAALTAFYESEARDLILQYLSQCIGADSVSVCNPYQVANDYDDHGYVDEGYCSHYPLPGKKIRAAMVKLKSLIEGADPFIASCFDRDNLHINVSGTSDFNPNTGQSYNEREFLTINSGILSPLAGSEEVICFTFKD